MGKRGPKAKPGWLKGLEGNPGKRPVTNMRLEPTETPPSCPSWLREEAKQEWRRLAPQLARRGLLTELDRTAFACYCQSYADWRQAQQAVEERGAVYVTPRGQLRERPEVAIGQRYLKFARDFGAEFGLSPESRSAFPPDAFPDEDDESDLD